MAENVNEAFANIELHGEKSAAPKDTTNSSPALDEHGKRDTKNTEVQKKSGKVSKIPKLVKNVKTAPTKNIVTGSDCTKLVENIDFEGDGNVILVPEYVNDIYAYLYRLETKFPINVNHLEKQNEITPTMRAVLIDWIIEVQNELNLVSDTFHMAVGFIDRYLQAVHTTLAENLQLVGITSLFIAAKYEEVDPPSVRDFLNIAADTYNHKQILEMEKRIWKVLDFHVGRPVSIHFLRRFSLAAKDIDNTQKLLSRYFIELVSVEYSLAHYKPSEIAASALFLSLKLLPKSGTPKNVKDDYYWTPTLEFYSQYSIEHLTPLIKKIAILVRGASKAKLKAVFNKYRSSRFDWVSIKSELIGTVMESICSA